jgi:hypothetical protein
LKWALIIRRVMGLLRLSHEHTYSSLVITFVDKVKPSGCYDFPDTIKIHSALRRMAPALIGSGIKLF